MADRTEAGAAIYMDARSDVDPTVQGVDVSDMPAVESAVRTVITIRDERAPRRYAFPLDLPDGAKAIKANDGSVQVRNAAGGVIGIVAKPWAVDSKGRDVPTRFAVRANRIIQVVDHRGAAYPVIADPVWFVPVTVVGSRIAVKIAVKALTKKGAKRAAKKTAKRYGHKVKSVGKPIKGKFRTAGGFQIQLGQTPAKADGFKSFRAFKKRWGGAGKNRQWHHIVEQSTLKRADKSIRPKRWQIHNRMNIVSIPEGIHRECITALMGTKLKNIPLWQLQRLTMPLTEATANLTLRGALTGYSYRNMHLIGLRLLDLCGLDVVGDGI